MFEVIEGCIILCKTCHANHVRGDIDSTPGGVFIRCYVCGNSDKTDAVKDGSSDYFQLLIEDKD